MGIPQAKEFVPELPGKVYPPTPLPLCGSEFPSDEVILNQYEVEYAVTNIRDAAQNRGLVELERGATMVLDSIRLVMVSEIPAAMRNETDPRCYSSALMRFVRDLVISNPVAGVEILTAAFEFMRFRSAQLGNHEVVAKLDEITRLFEIKEKAGSDPPSWRVQ